MEPQRRWDAAAYHRASDVQEARVEALLGRLPLRGDETVLGAGCGSRRSTLRLLERLLDGHVVAVDSSAQMVEHARETLGDRATVIHADLTELELEQPVDAIFSNAVFHWVRTTFRLFTRMWTALRPAGIMVAGFGASGNLEELFGIAAEISDEAATSPRSASRCFHVKAGAARSTFITSRPHCLGLVSMKKDRVSQPTSRAGPRRLRADPHRDWARR